MAANNNRFMKFKAVLDLASDILKDDSEEQYKKFDVLVDKLAEFIKSLPKQWLGMGESYCIWLYFKELQKQKDISQYLTHVKKRQTSEKDDKKLEVLCFFEVEILMSKGTINHSNDERTKELYQRYPFNSDFKHSYAQVIQDKDLEESIRLLKDCIQDWECQELIRRKNNLVSSEMEASEKLGITFAESIVMTTHGLELGICKDYFEKGEYAKSKERLDTIKEDQVYHGVAILSVTNQAFENLFYAREYIDAETKKKQNELEKEVKDLNKTNVETLGVFSAIITFIITAALAMFKDESALSPIYMIAIGIILIVFILTMQITANPIAIKSGERDGGIISLFKNDFRATILAVYTLLIACTLVVTSFVVQPKKQDIENIVDRAKIELSAESNAQLSTLRRSADKILEAKTKSLDDVISEKEKLFTKHIDDVSNSNITTFESEMSDLTNAEEIKFRKELTNMASIEELVKGINSENPNKK